MAITKNQDVNEYLSRSSGPTYNSFTACFWAKVTDAQNAQVLLNVGDATGVADCTQVYVNSSLYAYLGDHDSDSSQGPQLTAGTWHHFAWVRNGTSTSLYVDGATGPTLSTAEGSAGNWFIGVVSPSNYYAAGLTMAHLKMWDGVQLTQAEIQQEMRTARPQRLAGLWGWYPFIGSKTADLSGNGRDWTESGTLDLVDGPPVGWGAPPQLLVSQIAGTPDVVLRNPGSLTAATAKGWRGGSAFAAYVSAGSVYRFNKPSGLASGDLWVLLFSIQQNVTVSLPAGYTKHVDKETEGSNYTTIWSRICDGTEPSYVDVTGWSGDPFGAQGNFAFSGCSGLEYYSHTKTDHPNDGDVLFKIGSIHVPKNDALDFTVAFNNDADTHSSWSSGVGTEALDTDGVGVAWRSTDAGFFDSGTVTSNGWATGDTWRFVFVPSASQPSGAANVILAEEAAAAEGGGTLPWSNIWRPSRV